MDEDCPGSRVQLVQRSVRQYYDNEDLRIQLLYNYYSSYNVLVLLPQAPH